MILSSELLPAPLPPITPIFAPKKKQRDRSLITTLSGGWTRERFWVV